MMDKVTVVLKEGREKSVLRRHPWIFSGAVEGVDSPTQAPVIAEVVDHQEQWLARGILNPKAELAVRLLTWREDAKDIEALVRERIQAAVRMRMERFTGRDDTDACRLVFSEADGLSGLIVDRYGDTLAVRVGARGMEPLLEVILAALKEATGLTAFHVTVDSEEVEREGLDAAAVFSRSTAPDAPVRIRENGLIFEADLRHGQKTGFFLDQRENRMRVASYAAGRRVLSAYCYTGGFEVCAARAGAREVLGLDSSEDALAQARKHHELNGLQISAIYDKADVPLALRGFRDRARTFDMIILDPPRFVFNKTQKEKGMRAYKDINLLALKLLTPGGILATFSCSGLITGEDFRTIIQWSAIDAGRAVQIVESLSQPFDHPVLATFPESDYLKGLVCRVG